MTWSLVLFFSLHSHCDTILRECQDNNVRSLGELFLLLSLKIPEFMWPIKHWRACLGRASKCQGPRKGEVVPSSRGPAGREDLAHICLKHLARPGHRGKGTQQSAAFTLSPLQSLRELLETGWRRWHTGSHYQFLFTLKQSLPSPPLLLPFFLLLSLLLPSFLIVLPSSPFLPPPSISSSSPPPFLPPLFYSPTPLFFFHHCSTLKRNHFWNYSKYVESLSLTLSNFE